MPSESTVSAEPDKHPKAAEPAQNMRRTKSKLSLDTLASVESMNCTIIDYSQLEVKRKIGDGSIGQVSCSVIYRCPDAPCIQLLVSCPFAGDCGPCNELSAYNNR